jgi:hypothetical protein
MRTQPYSQGTRFLLGIVLQKRAITMDIMKMGIMSLMGHMKRVTAGDIILMVLEMIIISMIIIKKRMMTSTSLMNSFMKVTFITAYDSPDLSSPELKKELSKTHENDDIDFEYSVTDSADIHYRRRFSRSRSRSGHRKAHSNSS